MTKESFIFNKMLLFLVVFCLLSVNGHSQPPTQDPYVLSGAYHPASYYKTSWQRLLLQLSSTYFTVVTENQVDIDSSLIYASHSLGLSRQSVLTEGIVEPDVAGKWKWIDKRDPKEGMRLLSASTGKTKLELLVLLGAYYAFQPGSYYHDKDNVLYFLNRAVSESKAQGEQQLGRQARLLIAKMYVQAYDFHDSDPIFDRLISDCQSAGDITTEAKVLYYRGLYAAFTPTNIPQRISYLQQARQLYGRQSNTEGEIIVLTDICYLYVASGQLPNAYKAAVEALGLAESIHFPYTHYNTDAAAMVTMFEGKFGEPLKYALETIKTAEESRDSIGWGYFYNRLGIMYIGENNKADEVRKWNEKAVYNLMRSGSSNALYLSLYDLVNVLLSNNQADKARDIAFKASKKAPPKSLLDKFFYNLAMAAIFGYSNQYDTAQSHLEIADSIETLREKAGGVNRRALVNLDLGNLYFRKGDYVKSKIFFERILSAPLHMDVKLINELNALDRLINIDSVRNDQPSEISHLRLRQQLADSNYKVSTLRQAEELQVKYATEEKETQFNLLNQKEKLEHENLQQADRVRDATIGGIVLVFIIALLIYQQNRVKQKSNESITHKNDLLQHLLTEKEWLLKEVHHRVKNNLHTVICLLESQARYLENDALKAIENSQHRIYAMSLIHQKLYQSDDIKKIDMAVYIPELVKSLKEGFGTSDQIKFNLKMDLINLDISHAIPLGLIINEAVTNSIKYAFPGNAKGEISISMTAHDGLIQLEIADNGIGMPEIDWDIEPESLGLRLIKGLSEDIDAEISFAVKNGIRIMIAFKHDVLNAPENFLTSTKTMDASGIMPIDYS
jgi:two-component sensor histidine kinase